MKFVLGAVLYLFFCGLALGPMVGDEIRCGESPKVKDALIFAFSLPMVAGMALTAGEIPKHEGCEKPQ